MKQQPNCYTRITNTERRDIMGLGTILVVIGEIINLLEDEDDSCK